MIFRKYKKGVFWVLIKYFICIDVFVVKILQRLCENSTQYFLTWKKGIPTFAK